MSKPLVITELLAELADEVRHSSVDTHSKSKAVVWIHPDDYENEEGGIELNAKDCSLLFHSADTVHRFLDLLGDTEEASLCLFDVGVTHPVLDLLERSFVSVDEG